MTEATNEAAAAQFKILANLVLGNMLTLGYVYHSQALVRYATYLAGQINDPTEWAKILAAVNP